MLRLIVICCVLITLGCARFSTNEISELRAHPERFEGQLVSVKGEVVHQLSLPIVDYRGYYVGDDSGQFIFVVTPDEPPALHRSVRVRGRFHRATAFGLPLGVFLSETERRE
jgi:hypothetical protein